MSITVIVSLVFIVIIANINKNSHYHNYHDYPPIQEESYQRSQSYEGLKDCSSPCAGQRGMEPNYHHTDYNDNDDDDDADYGRVR